MSEPDESRWIAAAKAGDRPAFGLLVQLHQSRLRLSARQWTRGDAALADDIAQEAFIRAWQKLPLFDGRARFATWLYRIAFNLWLNQRTKQQHEADSQHEDAAHCLQSDAHLQRDLNQALAQLSEPQQLAIHLCLQRDFSHAEAAHILQLPVGTVKTHVNRGRQKLQQLMADYTPHTEGFAHG